MLQNQKKYFDEIYERYVLNNYKDFNENGNCKIDNKITTDFINYVIDDFNLLHISNDYYFLSLLLSTLDYNDYNEFLYIISFNSYSKNMFKNLNMKLIIKYVLNEIKNIKNF